MNEDTPVDPSRHPDAALRHEPGVIQRARRFLRTSFPDVPPHVVVGYSGGKDSLALLLVLRELHRLGGCRVTAVHVDHQLRPDSGEAAARSMQVAQDLGVDVVLKTAQGSLRRALPGQSVEDIARRFRYQMLTRVLEDVGGDAIAVAHHQRDQAETVLLHLVRGSGLSGLRGMLPDSLLAVTWMQKPGFGPATVVRVIRPFLQEAPEALADIVRESGVPVIEDPSNDDAAFRRNRVRHELLPLLEDISPGAMSRLVSLSDIVHEDDVALNDVTDRLLERAVERDALVWETFRGAPRGLQRRVIRRWIGDRRGLHDLSLDRIDAVIAVAERGGGGKSVEVGGGWLVTFVGGVLRIVAPSPS